MILVGRASFWRKMKEEEFDQDEIIKNYRKYLNVSFVLIAIPVVIILLTD